MASTPSATPAEMPAAASMLIISRLNWRISFVPLPLSSQTLIGSEFSSTDVRQRRKNSNRLGTRICKCLYARPDQCKRSCGNSNHHPFCIRFDGLAPSKCSIGRVPGCQSIDLRSNNTRHKFDGAIGKLNRPENKSIGPQHHFDFAAGRNCCQLCCFFTFDVAFYNANRVARCPGNVIIYVKDKLSVCLLDKANRGRGRESAEQRQGQFHDGINPAGKYRADRIECQHRSFIHGLPSATVWSNPSRQDNTAYGWSPSSNSRITTSAFSV